MEGITLFLWVLICIVCILIGFLLCFWMQVRKGGKSISQEEKDHKEALEEQKKIETKEARSQNMRDFMEFDKIEDDMIVQNNGTRFSMVISCKGINYDLMSENEMLSVEEGFANFLNTLKFPIQLYVQSRTLDLSEGISVFRERMSNLKKDNTKYIENVNRAKSSNPNLTLAQKQQMDFEIRKKRNLIDYGEDIVSYIERMSSNRDILQRKYYIVVSYETAELSMTSNLNEYELKEAAYSELYTRCKTLQGAIMPCGIETNILTSEDLADILFVAYNKDDAINYSIKEAIKSGIYRLYSTATSVREKKKAALDEKIKNDAIAEAENALRNAMNSINNPGGDQVDISGLTEEQKIEDDTKREAMQIIVENQDNFDPEAVDKALQDLNSQMHQPVVSQEELDAAADSVTNDGQENAYTNAATNTFTKDPLEGLLF